MEVQTRTVVTRSREEERGRGDCREGLLQGTKIGEGRSGTLQHGRVTTANINLLCICIFQNNQMEGL